MARKSKIDRLPLEIQDQIAELRAGGHTIDEIMAHLRLLLNPADLPGRSGLGLHIQGLDKLAEQVNFGRKIAEALVRPLGDAPESRQARLNIELMHGITTKLLMSHLVASEDGEEVTLTAQEAHFLAKSLDHLTRAQNTDAKTILALRDVGDSGKDGPDRKTPDAEGAIFDIPGGRQ